MSERITFPEQTKMDVIRRVLFYLESDLLGNYDYTDEEREAAYTSALKEYNRPDSPMQCVPHWAALGADSVEALFFSCEKQRMAGYYYLTYRMMSKEDCANAFTIIWPTLFRGAFNRQIPKQETLAILQSVDRNDLMDDDELKAYDNLPDELTIYRGVEEQNPRYIKSFAWTTSIDDAKWYAQRFCFNPEESPHFVYEARIAKKDIFAIWNYELVVNYKKLKDVHLIWQVTPEESMYKNAH